MMFIDNIYNMYTFMQCIRLCNVYFYAMYTFMQCILLCNVYFYAMYFVAIKVATKYIA